MARPVMVSVIAQGRSIHLSGGSSLCYAEVRSPQRIGLLP